MLGLALLVVSLVLANLPFIAERRFAVFKSAESKNIGCRFFELGVFYAIAMGIGLALEASTGPIYPKRWEFFGITACMFLVMAFPGFVYRYLYLKK